MKKVVTHWSSVFKTVKELTLASNFLHFVVASAIDIANLIAELSFSLADHS
jgi:hypothetical protein